MTKGNYKGNAVLDALRAGYNAVRAQYQRVVAAVQGPELAFAGMPYTLEQTVGEYASQRKGLPGQKAEDLYMHTRGNSRGKKKGSGRLHEGSSTITVRAGGQDRQVDLNGYDRGADETAKAYLMRVTGVNEDQARKALKIHDQKNGKKKNGKRRR